MVIAGQKPIRVLTVDDHALLRNGIRRLIGSESDMQVVAEASTGREAVEEFRAHCPEITLMDTQMPDMTGIETIIAIPGSAPIPNSVQKAGPIQRVALLRHEARVADHPAQFVS